MTRTLTYSITTNQENMTIGQFLKAQGYSRQNIIALKKLPDSILVNGRWEYVTYSLKAGEQLTIIIQEDASSEKIVPVKLPLSIIYEDEDMLVVNKPANMPIHPSLNNYENTLANAVAYYYKEQNLPFVFRCINRLDRDTTGLTILAKNMLSAGILSEMISRREIKREYLALADGIGISPKSGTIDAPIARIDGSTIERCVDFEKGERAVTHYEVLNESVKNNLSLINLWLETGRTHQIRVHMKYIGHPLIGDFLYHPGNTQISRQALHAHRLTLLHPITKQPLCFTAPLPDDMEAFL
ncbi:MAG: RluA family pseudouridine synthase [Lachnospiraceae bacterium]|nr:RluA family pseudouridine synthase [Lachnospiraceae bacterium]